MSDFQRINAPRIEKIEAILGQIEKSARSQRVSEEERAALLAPLTHRFAPGDSATPETPKAAAASEEPFVADEDMRRALQAVTRLRWGHAQLLADAIPDTMVSTVVTHLIARLNDMAANERGS